MAGVGHRAPAGGDGEGVEDGGDPRWRLGCLPPTKQNHPPAFLLQVMVVMVMLVLGCSLTTKPNHPSTSPHRPSGWERGCKTGRKDGRDLVGEWRRRHPQGQAVHTREELRQVNFNSTEQLLGLFSHSMMPYDDERESEGMITPR